MNYEEKTVINENVINSYFRLYRDYLISIIEQDIENSIEIKLSSEDYVYMNLDDFKILIFKKKRNSICDIFIKQYTEFISDEFLEKFYIHIEEFPISLRKIIPNKERLRVEILENIKRKNIIIFYDEKENKYFAKWKKYDLTMYLENNFEFKYIVI